MKVLFLTLILSLSLSHVTALPTKDAEGDDQRGKPNPTPTPASTPAPTPTPNTCGDTTSTTTFFEGFKPSVTSHAPDDIPDFVSLSAGDDIWDFNPPSFRAWIAPGQASTVPLYWLFNPTTHDYVYLTSDTTTLPSVSGYGSANLIAYVYSTPICNSVPLYCVSKPSDHWYTTNLAEHNDFVNQHGWTDCGITAYVLPIDNVSEIVA